MIIKNHSISKLIFHPTFIQALLIFFLSLSALTVRENSFVLNVLLLLSLCYFLKYNKHDSIITPPPVKFFLLCLVLFSLRILLDLIFHGQWHKLFQHEFAVYFAYVFFPMFAHLLNRQSNPTSVLKIIIFVSLYSWILLYWLYSADFPYRGHRVIKDPITAAFLSTIYATLCLMIANTMNSKFWNYLAVLGAAGGLILTALLVTRATWLAIPIVCATIIPIMLRKKLLRPAHFYILLIIIIGVVLVSIESNLLPVLKNRLIQLMKLFNSFMAGDFENSNNRRLQAWFVNYSMFTENPLFGAGFDSSKNFFASMFPSTRAMGHPHNDYLQVASELGLSGLILFCGITLYPPYYYIRNLISSQPTEQQLNILCLCGLVLTVYCNLFMLTNDVIAMKYTSHTYAILNIILMISITKVKQTFVNENQRPNQQIVENNDKKN